MTKQKKEENAFPFLKTAVISLHGTFEKLADLSVLQNRWLKEHPFAIPIIINQSMTNDTHHADYFTVIINIWYEEIDPKVLAASHPLFKPLEKTEEEKRKEEPVRFPVFSPFPQR